VREDGLRIFAGSYGLHPLRISKVGALLSRALY
jgi:hypothetical protein